MTPFLITYGIGMLAFVFIFGFLACLGGGLKSGERVKFIFATLFWPIAVIYLIIKFVRRSK